MSRLSGCERYTLRRSSLSINHQQNYTNIIGTEKNEANSKGLSLPKPSRNCKSKEGKRIC